MPKLLSLWLLPPKPQYTTLQKQITDISNSSVVNGKKKYPNFMPHVTILGGVPHPNVDDVDDLLKELQESFKTFKGGIECDFVANPPLLKPPKETTEKDIKWGKRVELAVDGIIGVLSDNNTSNSVTNDNNTDEKKEKDILQWNQCCVALLKRTPSLLNAIRLSHPILYPNHPTPSCDNDFFKPPVNDAHYSFVYGMESADEFPREVITKLPENFVSRELVLLWTYPACVEHVEDWAKQEIGRIKLLNDDDGDDS